jgi:hypothetical protein
MRGESHDTNYVYEPVCVTETTHDLRTRVAATFSPTDSLAYADGTAVTVTTP